jgi:hypothetical protein
MDIVVHNVNYEYLRIDKSLINKHKKGSNENWNLYL